MQYGRRGIQSINSTALGVNSVTFFASENYQHDTHIELIQHLVPRELRNGVFSPIRTETG